MERLPTHSRSHMRKTFPNSSWCLFKRTSRWACTKRARVRKENLFSTTSVVAQKSICVMRRSYPLLGKNPCSRSTSQAPSISVTPSAPPVQMLLKRSCTSSITGRRKTKVFSSSCVSSCTLRSRRRRERCTCTRQAAMARAATSSVTVLCAPTSRGPAPPVLRRASSLSLSLLCCRAAGAPRPVEVRVTIAVPEPPSRRRELLLPCCCTWGVELAASPKASSPKACASASSAASASAASAMTSCDRKRYGSTPSCHTARRNST
mmetsp:Transcript_86146/g.184596  ORF Transcript_86146/g.184596 Transcript_86146/m.184596 type:complete len:263 (+) Transcript_86146:886-1674(+)